MNSGSANQIASDLGGLGVQSGQTILVHSSFKALGSVTGGIETVIRGLLQTIGPEGTLLMPALSWSTRPSGAFDVRSTASNVGAITEYFRLRKPARRSLHPTHSVCAVGPRTDELLDGHERDNTPCGKNSPFRKLADTGGKIVMLGCGLKPNTTMHALEECAKTPYSFGESQMFTITDAQGRSFTKEYRTYGMGDRGFSQRYDRVLKLDTQLFLQSGRVLQAETFIMDAPGLKQAVLDKLGEDALFFVDREQGGNG